MPYKVEDIGMNATLESTLNKFEKQGWTLVAVIPPFRSITNSDERPQLVLHKPGR